MYARYVECFLIFSQGLYLNEANAQQGLLNLPCIKLIDSISSFLLNLFSDQETRSLYDFQSSQIEWLVAIEFAV